MGGMGGTGGIGASGGRRDAGDGELAAEVALEGLRVLVVDDEPDTREILSEILRGAGATVATAASLGETLSLFDPFRPDVLVSDIAMPGGDGYSLIRQVRRRGQERGGGVAAIAVSAHAREEDRRRALAAGFERYVTKPVEPAFLLAVVQEVAPVVRRAAAAGGAGGGIGEASVVADRADRTERADRADRDNGHGGHGGHGGGGGVKAVGEAVGRRILLVEDDADTREALKTLLELNGHEVAVASNGGDAVAHAIEHRPEVALVDIGLPEMDGNEVARRIRAKLGTGGIFLVALTGYGGEADIERARAAGFDAHFTKPVELARLDRLLRSDASGVTGSSGATGSSSSGAGTASAGAASSGPSSNSVGSGATDGPGGVPAGIP
jgi:CheY-like chemotaxis protein